MSPSTKRLVKYHRWLGERVACAKRLGHTKTLAIYSEHLKLNAKVLRCVILQRKGE